MHVYEKTYNLIPFLNDQTENFIAWICPLLTTVNVPMDQYIYYETDLIGEIFFLSTGWAGFVLPFKQNVVYIDIGVGDFFGEADFAVTAAAENMDIDSMFELINQ